MIDLPPREDDETERGNEAFASTEAEPRLFVRLLTTPPALPWEQSGGAVLEARMAAPIPIEQLICQVQRIGRWSLRAPGRFAALYFRRSDLKTTFETTVEVEGNLLKVRFENEALRSTRQRSRIFLITVAGLTAIFLGLAIAHSIQLRLGLERQLADLEFRYQRALEVEGRIVRLKRQTVLLSKLQVEHNKIRDVVNDLNWISQHKTPEAKIQSLHWDDGFMVVETRGTPTPFANVDRELRKSNKTLPPGLMLFGVGRAGAQRSVDPRASQQP